MRVPDLGGEGVVAAAACAVQPPDLPIGTFLRQCVKHGENRGGSDTRTDQQDRCIGWVEDEGAARRCDFETVANCEAGVKKATCGSIVLALDRDPVVAGVGRTGEGVIPEHRSLLAVGLDPQREVLARAWGRERCAVGSSTRIEMTESLSRTITVTVRRRKPGQAGGGLALARPALPPPGSPSSNALNDVCQPGLRAGMRSARSSCGRGCPGR